MNQGCVHVTGSIPLDFGTRKSCFVALEYDVLEEEYSPPLMTSLGAAGPQMCFEVVSH